jgi:trans-2,3-dihydro-3-hydroxyanthranilate isomerase
MTSRRHFIRGAASIALAQTVVRAGGYAVERWNVFTKDPLNDDPKGGNPLVVFLDAEGLSAEQMQRFGHDINLSEVMFLFPRQSKPGTVKARIFNRTSEMVFAGHPILGAATAVWTDLPAAQRKPVMDIVLDVPIGPITVTMTKEGDTVYGEMLQTDPVFAETHEPEKIAKILQIPVSGIVREYTIQNVSTGRPNLIVMVDSLRTAAAVNVDGAAMQAYFASGDSQRGFYILCRSTVDKSAQIHARKPAAIAANEDPATGSAAGPAIAWMVKYGLAASGKKIAIEQGIEVHRPGRIMASAIRNGDKITGVRVGGYSVRVERGTMSPA